MNKYPNFECGERPIWLAFEGPREEMIKLCKKRHCDLVDTEFECDGRCLSCDYFHEVRGCAMKEGL